MDICMTKTTSPTPGAGRSATSGLAAAEGSCAGRGLLYPVYLAYLFVFSMLFAACTIPEPLSPRSAGPSVPDRLLVRIGGRVTSVSLEQYVIAAALSEVTPLNEAPATVESIYEVQAVVARTYAISHSNRHRAEGFDLCDTTHCQ